MNGNIRWLTAAAMLVATLPLVAAEKRNSEAYKSNQAVIVVTGMILDEDPANYRQDLSVAEGAVVKVTARGAEPREKTTAAFVRGGKKGGGRTYYTADFGVDLDATYDIEMKFKDGTVIRITDYRLPKEWKTHFYFHGTTGTLSPSSILRVGEDKKTKQRCCVYAVYPPEAYRKLGGKQNP